jgi:hypothetical protein
MRPRWMLLQLMRKKACALLARVSARASVDRIRGIVDVAGGACPQYVLLWVMQSLL